MKILFLINNLGGGGAERVVQSLANYMVEREGHEVIVVTLQSRQIVYKLDPRLKQRTFKTGVLNHGPGKILSLPLQGCELAYLLRQEKPDAAISLLVRANLVHVISRWFGNRQPIVLSERNRSDHQYRSTGLRGRTMRRLIRWLYPKADAIVAISEGVKKSLESLGVPPKLVKVIYNPQHLNYIEECASESISLELNGRGPILVTIGRLIDQKDHVTLLEAFAQVHEKTDVRLIIIGEGPKRQELEQIARDLAVSQRVCFAGWQSNPFALMKQSNVFVLSSRFEGFGNVIVEAMACGLPVVSTDCPSGPREILKEGEAGILVPVGDRNALAQAIITLLTDSNALNRYKKASAERAADFDVSVIASQYLELLYRGLRKEIASQVWC